MNQSIWRFFGLSFLLTWLCWIPAGWGNIERLGGVSRLLHYAGGVMPMLVAVYLLFRDCTPAARQDYWSRLIDFRRIGRGWYAVIFLTAPALTLAAILLSREGAALDAASNIVRDPLWLVPFALTVLLFGPLPEEMAWRGYVLDGLQARWNALTASLFLGAAWTLWHLPLFWIAGSYQHGLGLGTPQFWLFMLDKVPQSILLTWIYNNNRRSTLSAVLFHFMVNLVGELFAISLRAEAFFIASWWVLAVLVAAIWKPQKLSLRD